MSSNFIHTYVSVDCVVFGFDNENRLNILLVLKHRDKAQIEKQRRLPGSLIFSDEDVDDAAQRVLHEITGIKKMVLKQFKCFADPKRASNESDIIWMGEEYKHHIDRIITVAYLSLCRIDQKINSTKYDTVDWFPIDKIPVLPFDHNLIIKESLVEIRKWVQSDFSIIFELLPKKFTIRQLYQLYNDLSERYIDIKNFHKKIASFNYIIPLDEIETNVSHRAARYYKFDPKVYRKGNNKLIK
ncbi:NUDIX domain-containing protein [Epilithonimonas sp. JDS]|uniref:NUDIX hydrolase n=1 Tax=Epilithonimonas sp. JDS TaxID=2902797 RepID=UPI001E5C1F1E|nr:NUDIX domain-containing protein [Epilithonimonas sp. JDS]MCD9853292.1 NUDIX domain-containing protein [Epilithonimonas sp. JDS]